MAHDRGRQLLLILALVVATCQLASASGPLQLTVATTKGVYSQGETITIVLQLKNVSESPVVLPDLGANLQTYFSFTVTQGNLPVFFLDRTWDTQIVPAATTMTLQPNQQCQLQDSLNNGGFGALAYLDPGNAATLQFVAGSFTVVAFFHVDASNLPTGGDPGVFLGVVSSADDGLSPSGLTTISKSTGDLNADGRVDCQDLAIVRASFGLRIGQTGFDARADINNDGIVDIRDQAVVSRLLPAGARCQ